MVDTGAVGFERLARPLLEIIHRLTGLETTYVTHIDWLAQAQRIVLALNTTAELEVPEGSVWDWSDSLCRRVFLEGQELSRDVPADFPGSLGAEIGLRTFVSVPIVDGEEIVGTVCGASRGTVEVDAEVMAIVRLVAEALGAQLIVAVEGQAQRARADRAEALALTDPLTELANRRAFQASLEKELARAARRGSPVAVLALDVDRFKAVNDTFGHKGGDAVLCALARVLRGTARVEDVAARLGGDEFALLLADGAAAGAEVVARRVADGFRRATRALGMPCTLSIGVSASDVTPRHALLQAADVALYRSKTGGRDRVEVSATAA